MNKLRPVTAFLLILLLLASCGTSAPADIPSPPEPDGSPAVLRPTPPSPSPSEEPEVIDLTNPGGAVLDISAVDISGIDPDLPMIALTFDDGPTMTTLAVLDKLEEHGVTATFFVLGRLITGHTEPILRRTFDAGHEIANHAWSHGDLALMTGDEVALEIKMTSDKIEEVTGVRPVFFRPPFLSTAPFMLDVIDLPFIHGASNNDWDHNVDLETRIDRALRFSSDGTFLLLHDFSGNDLTVESLDDIITELKERDFQFVTVSQMFAVRGVQPEVKIYDNLR
jgi:peptidoglycan/xylan/chitin deacetylase (PgdA/CDA1 family)